MSAGAALPAGVLVQSVYVDDEGEESGWRVWDDGRHESRRDGAPWEPVEVLGESALAAVRDALDGAGLAAMGGTHRGDDARRTATLRFEALAEGTPYRVELSGGARLEALDELTAQLIAALAGPGFPGVSA